MCIRDSIGSGHQKGWKGKIVEVIGVENKAMNRPDNSVGLEEKEYTLNDIFNLCNKRFDEMDKKWDEWLRELKTARLKENSEVELKQVSDNNVVNDSEGIINQVSDNDNSNNELINNSDKIVGEVVLTSEDNDGDYNSEVSRSDNYDDISENMMLQNNGVNIENTDEVLECNNCLLYTSRCV